VPLLSRWFIRAALSYLVIGFTLGALILVQKGIPLHPAFWQLLPAHIECLFLGWTPQLAMGMAFWILPRRLQGAGRGNEAAAWLAFGLINVGVIMVSVGWTWSAPSFIPLVGRVAEGGAAVAFAVHAWGRLKPLRAR
jgi:cbb3-type cytochrome oxidase subunit 1